MQWTSIIAIYALFLALSLFLVLPFGVQTDDEAGIEKIRGQADSAPTNFRPGRIAMRATILATVLFGLFYVNYVGGWISAQDLNFFGKPPGQGQSADGV
jgi:predicted secreted protein